QMMRLSLHREMMLATSLAGVRVQPSRWVPLDKTTRTTLAPVLAIWAMALVWLAYQVWAWLIPRITKGSPLPSKSWVPDTENPAQADEAISPTPKTHPPTKDLMVFSFIIVLLKVIFLTEEVPFNPDRSLPPHIRPAETIII